MRIAKVTAERLNITLGDGHYHRVAAAADYNPRVIGRLLATVRDIQVGHPGHPDPVALAMTWTGVSPDGLTRSCQDYLMLRYGYGGTAGLTTLKAALNESVVSHTEQALIARGLVAVTGKGRELTRLGTHRAESLLAETQE